MAAIRLLSLIAIFVITSGAAFAQTTSFDAWLAGMRDEALRSGISQSTVNAALSNVTPNERVIALDKKQPEKKMTFAQYRTNVVNQTRINEGRRLLAQHRGLLDMVSKRYGVQPQYIVALWGIETNFGGNTGGFNIVPALATLAWEGRRAEFFKAELIHALRIVDQGHIALSEFKGSWAGALGQCQFMPSSFHNFAVDGDGDGRKDIWNTKADVFSSTANYLSKSGWKGDETWGRAVRIPAGTSENLVGLEVKKTLSEWARFGVTNADGTALPSAPMTASLIAPDGVTGPTWLVYDNYRTIMKWNRSTYFATSVGLLANAIAQ